MEQTPHAAAARPPKDVGQDIIQQPERPTVQSMVSAGEIDQQIATAHRYPRSIRGFRDKARAMATLNEKVAEECFYAVPREGKTIEGPSARFAEIIASAWGNCRIGARVVAQDDEFIHAQGVFHDLETNVAITREISRRITNKHGKRFGADMIGVTGNAASSIALRNAVFAGIPKAMWGDIYEEARHVSMGDVKSLVNKRAETIAAFQKFNIRQEQILLFFNVKGVEDITIEMLMTLRGIGVAIKEGDVTPEEAFPPLSVGSARAPTPQPPPSAEPPAPASESQAAETPKDPAPPVTQAKKPDPKKAPPPAPELPPADESDYGGSPTPPAKPGQAKKAATSSTTEDLGWGEL